MKEITILGTTDIHGFDSRTVSEESGICSLPTLAKQYEQPILIDNGDFFVGSPEATFFNTTQKISPWVHLANDIGFDVMVPGNHDFDYGIEFLKQQITSFKGAYVCANVLDLENKRLFEPYTIIERQGIKIGIIGVITSAMPQISSYDKIKTLKFMDVLETLHYWVPIVKAKTDILIVSYHGGIERDMRDGKPTQYDTGEDQTYKIITEVTGIDGVICGHQHRVNEGLLNDTVFVQPGYRGNYVGKLSFEIDTQTKQLVEKSTTLLSTEEIKTNIKLKYSREIYQNWLSNSIDLVDFPMYLEKVTGTKFQSIELDGSTIQDLLTSFSPPYPISTYHLSNEEMKEQVMKQKIDGVELQEGRLIPDQTDYQVVTNTNLFPTYRLEMNHVINLFDEYLAYLKNKA